MFFSRIRAELILIEFWGSQQLQRSKKEEEEDDKNVSGTG